MKKYLLTILIIIGFFFILGCVTEQNEGTTISLKNLSADKELYHSSENVNLTARVYSKSDLKNVTVIATGINGRLNEKKILNLKKGINKIYFNYKLPRCNVCGGISAGDYNLSCRAIYENITIKKSITINIQQ
jgi:hypothetical protein